MTSLKGMDLLVTVTTEQTQDTKVKWVPSAAMSASMVLLTIGINVQDIAIQGKVWVQHATVSGNKAYI